ncbi:MAG: hypothetical protein ACI9V0_002811 [Parasphingorhabdus sp.]
MTIDQSGGRAKASLSDIKNGIWEREMRKSLLLAATAISAMSVPAVAQDQERGTVDDNVIIVTAQRQAQSAQDVPIAVSAFSGAGPGSPADRK